MPGRVPGIHVFLLIQDVDGRDEPGHDGGMLRSSRHINRSIRCGINGMSAGGIS